MTLFSSPPLDGRLHKVDTNAEQMNADVSAQHLSTRLLEASLKVRSESMRVNAEFDAIEDAPKRKLITDAST